MGQLIESWRVRRDALRHRRTELVGATRERGVAALGRVREGALDWRATLTARGERLRAEPAPWFRLHGVQLRIIERFDRSILVFGDRVREEIQRLSSLELGAPRPPAHGTARPVGDRETEPAKANVMQAKPSETKALKSKAPKTEPPKSKAPKTKAPKTKAPKTKAIKAKTAAGDAAAGKAAATGTTAKRKATKTKLASSDKKASARRSRTAPVRAAASAPAAASSQERHPAPTQEGVTSKRPRVAAKRASKRFLMPVANYDGLSAKEILAELPGLSEAQRETLAEHERAHKNRKTVLRAIEGSLEP